MKRLTKLLALFMALLLILPLGSALALGDGHSSTYTYNYDYWGDLRESPDAYRVDQVIYSVNLDLGDTPMRKPQSLFAIDNDLYVCDTGNNRILQLHREGNTFVLARIIDTVYSTDEDYALADARNTASEEAAAAATALQNAKTALTSAYESLASNSDKLKEQVVERTVTGDDTQYASYEDMLEMIEEAKKNMDDLGKTASSLSTTVETLEQLTQAMADSKSKADETSIALLDAEKAAEEGDCKIHNYAQWSVNADGKLVSKFNEPNDIAVDAEGNMYVADTSNNRVVKMDKDGVLLREFVKPDDSTFDQNLSFLPKKLVVDSSGRVFALATNVNKGVIKYEPNGVFTGFIGANQVTYSMWEYLWKTFFTTKEQRAQQAAFVPTEYENLYIDHSGFIYATNIVFSEYDLMGGGAKPIRRLNSIGSDILIKNDRYPPIGDLDWVEGNAQYGPSLFEDITAFDNDIYIAFDKTRGRIFGYDPQGIMLWAFGTKDNSEGAFLNAISIEHMGTDLLCLDERGIITVFTPTEYGNLIYKASDQYLKGDYNGSADTWREVLKLNANYNLAFIGIGRSLMRQEQYKEAMDYFQMGHDRTNYGRAYRYYRKILIEKNIGWVVAVVAVLIVVPFTVKRVKKMKAEVEAHERLKNAH